MSIVFKDENKAYIWLSSHNERLLQFPIHTKHSYKELHTGDITESMNNPELSWQGKDHELQE